MTFAYDSGGRQINEWWINSGGGVNRRITFTYDAVDQLLSVTDPDATLSFTYDSGGNMLTARTSGGGTGQPNVTLTYSYNQMHERLSMTDSLGTVGRTTYVYDAAHRLGTITRSLGGTEKTWLKFGYDNADKRTSIERSIAGSGTKILTTLAYDNASRLTTIQHKVSGGSALATFVYGYNSGGLITTETNAEGLATYSYDDTNQLTGVDRPVGQTDESYGYDLNGNRNTTGYTVSGGNTMTASPGYTYTYDAEGNTSAKTETATGKVTTYSYDHRNRLTGVTQKNSGGSVIMQATYTYDALGRRIKTDVDADGAGGGSATVTWSMYDGHNTYADFNSGGTLTMRYLHGLAIDELYARMDSGGTSAWYLTDHLGTVLDVVDTSGASLYHASYEAFGSIIATTGTGDRFSFTGRELDSTVGLQFNRARYYVARLGKWLTCDPLGLSAGDTNLFRYTLNAPGTLIDALGLSGSYPPGNTGQPKNDNDVGARRDSPQGRRPTSPQRYAVVLYDGNDSTLGAGFTEAATETLAASHIDMTTWEDTLEKVKKHYERWGPIRVVVIYDHGLTPIGVQEVGDERLTVARAKQLAKYLDQRSSAVWLYGCETGLNDSYCHQISIATGSYVVANPGLVYYTTTWRKYVYGVTRPERPWKVFIPPNLSVVPIDQLP